MSMFYLIDNDYALYDQYCFILQRNYTVNQQILAAIKFNVSQNKVICSY